MNPRKAKDLLPKLVTPDLPIELLEDLTDFFWEKEVVGTLSGIEDLHVMIPHLGTFNIRYDNLVVREIIKVEEYILSDRATKRAPSVKYLAAKTKYHKLMSLMSRRREETKLKKQNKLLRKQIRDAKDSMGTPQGDPSGID